MNEYDEHDAQIWGEKPPRDGVDQYARETDPFHKTGWEAPMTTTDPAERWREWARANGVLPQIDKALAAAEQRGRDEAVDGRVIGVRLRDAFWIDSQHYRHHHKHGETVTHEVGEWCPQQLIGQNYPCPPSHDEVAKETAILDAQADHHGEVVQAEQALDAAAPRGDTRLPDPGVNPGLSPSLDAQADR